MKEAIKHLLSHCGNLKAEEKLCIICDTTTYDIADMFQSIASEMTPHVDFFELEPFKKHGDEPPVHVCESMLQSDLIISLCQFSLAHSQARIDAGKVNARFLSMPFYTRDLLNDEAVMIDFKAQTPIVRQVTDLFTNNEVARIQTKAGTDLTINFKGRVGNCCPGYVEKSGDLGSPPDIEANISPIESMSNGVIVVDGSITCTEIGLLQTPVVLKVEDGRIVEFESDNQDYVDILNEMFGDIDSKRRILAECGVGLNPKAKLTGTMLTDEGALGCIHFGFGSNYTVGGENEIDFHLDFVLRNGSLTISDVRVLEDGSLIL